MSLAPFFTRQQRHGGGRQALSPRYREMDDVNRQFGDLIRVFFGDPTGLIGAAVTPPVDIEETDDAYVVDVDLPNVAPEDVNVEMRGEELRISGQVQQRERTGVVRRQNRPTGEFEYLVDLPSDIDPNRVEATYQNGVLTVTVGKAQSAQPRRIEIRPGDGQQQQGMGQSDRQGEGRGNRQAT
jgi:HSP20 family protein